MGNLTSLALMIINIYQFIWNYFGKGEKGKANDEPVDRFYTPPPANSRSSNRDFKNANERGKRTNSHPKGLPSRLPKTFPLTRNPSQIFLLGSDACKGTPVRQQAIIRNRGSITNLRNLTNNALDFSFLESGNKIARRKGSLQDYRSISAVKDQVDMHLNDESPECCDDFIIRNLRLRSAPHTAPGCTLPYKYKSSRIPIPIRCFGRTVSPKPVQFMNFTGRPRGFHTIKKNSFGMSGYQDITDTPRINRFDHINNVFTFRNDTNMKFERIFKSLSKKKHCSATSIIDAASHAHWMTLAGIDVDKNALMFKNFAGGKIVLTLGEYKFFLSKISSAHGMDYWDVLLRMTTFDEEEE